MSKEKQKLECEMAEMLEIIEKAREIYANDITDHTENEYIREGLLDAGYRKQSKNTVELPCKVGDTVYRVKKRRGVWCILPREVVSITYRLDYLHRVEWEIFSTETDTLGKTVFLTEAEAEQALAKMKGGAE
jgi:hypothetical protein